MKRYWSVGICVLLLSSCGFHRGDSSRSGHKPDQLDGRVKHSGDHQHDLLQPLEKPKNLPQNAQLGEAILPMRTMPRPLAMPDNVQSDRVELRVLILSSGKGDYGLNAAQNMLHESGVPYDVFDASHKKLSWKTLIREDGVGRYQGIMLTTNALVALQDGRYQSAMEAAEWKMLFDYERKFGVRQLALYGFPGVVPEDYGIRTSGEPGNQAQIKITNAGAQVLNDLTSAKITMENAYMHPARIEKVDGIQVKPLITDEQNRILAVESNVNGRERILLTMAQNSTLLHTQLISYGLIKWLTKGVHLGEHRRFLQIDIDDWFAPSDHFDAGKMDIYSRLYRLSAKDALNVLKQQNKIRKDFKIADDFIYAIMFNGGETVTNVKKNCNPIDADKPADLAAATKCLAEDFDWVNHTTHHRRMDVMDYDRTIIEVEKNIDVGKKLGLKMSHQSLVTGEHSGLGFMDPNDDGTKNDKACGPKKDLGLGRSNPNLLKVARQNNIQYMASDHSVTSHRDNKCYKCGVVHTLNKDILLIPRWPNAIAYHVTTPKEATKFYNSIYGPKGKFPHWDKELSYQEMLDKESGFAFGRILKGAPFPHYMHQPNLNQYAANTSLSTDWIRSLIKKYQTYSKLPLNTMLWDDLGKYVHNLTVEEKAKSSGKLTGIWDKTSHTVTVYSSAGTLPFTLTGARNGEPYHQYRIKMGQISGSKTFSVVPQ